MRMILAILLGVAMAAGGLGAQEISTDSIRTHGLRLISDTSLQHREYSFRYLNRNLGRWMEQQLAKQDSVSEFPGLTVQRDKAGDLHIVTYELYRDTSDYLYGGWMKLPGKSEAVFLQDASREIEEDPDLDYMELDPEYWYGTLYYQLYPFLDQGKRKVYLLFGLDNYHFFTKRKVIDVLVLEDGIVRFGAPVIETEPDLPKEYRKNRFILDYSVQAPASLRYDPDHKKIIFDHLIFMRSDYKEQKVMKVPDGTYSGFELIPEKEKIVFIEKVFHQTLEEAPGGRPEPKVKRNILGEPVE